MTGGMVKIAPSWPGDKPRSLAPLRGMRVNCAPPRVKKVTRNTSATRMKSRERRKEYARFGAPSTGAPACALPTGLSTAEESSPG